jgi:hemerythrin-like domain-containing protein
MLVTHEGGVSGEASIRQDTETVGKASSRGEAATPRETGHPRETVGNAYPRRKENLRTSWRTEVPAAYTVRARAKSPRTSPSRKRTARKRTASGRSTRKPSTMASAGTSVRGAVAGAVVAVSRRLPWTADADDIITLLEADHRRMETLLKQGAETTERAVVTRVELLDKIIAELNLHENIEEGILYPALKAHPEARDIVLEGFQEHHVADLLGQELQEVAEDDERWGAKFKVFKENLEHHIQEEESSMFRTARAVISREELQRLGARMTEMKAETRREA